MERRTAILTSAAVGILAGAVCGVLLGLLFSRQLLTSYLFSSLVYGLAGGLAGLGGAALLAVLMKPARAMRIASGLIVTFFVFLCVAYWGNKWLLAGNAFTSTPSVLFDIAGAIVSLAIGGIVAWRLAPSARTAGPAGALDDRRPMQAERLRGSVAGRLLLVFALIFIVLPAALLIGITGRAPLAFPKELAGAPSVVLISIDTLRADHLGCYGYNRNTSPVLDDLASAGVRFENVCCPVPATSPSHATILTGLSPQKHGVRANAYKLPDSLTTIAEMMKADGYVTGGFTSCMLLDERFGFSQGFDTYIESGHVEKLAAPHLDLLFQTLAVKEVIDRLRSASGPDPTILAAQKWLAHNSGRPFFMFVHLLDVHAPYEPLEPYRAKFPADTTGLGGTLWVGEGHDPAVLARNVSLYDAEIAQADAKVGRLLATLRNLGVLDHTLVVLTGDHGENLGEHEPFFAHWDVYDTVLRVPLVMALPGVLAPGRVVPEIVENSAIAPTILALAGQSIPPSVEGEDLVPLIDGVHSANAPADRAPEIPEVAASAASTTAPVLDSGFDDRFAVSYASRYALRTDDWKLMVDFSKGQVQLYDLVHDPGERNDVNGLHDDRTARMLGALRATLEKREGYVRAQPSEEIPVRELDRRTLEALKGLGYIDK